MEVGPLTMKSTKRSSLTSPASCRLESRSEAAEPARPKASRRASGAPPGSLGKVNPGVGGRLGSSGVARSNSNSSGSSLEPVVLGGAFSNACPSKTLTPPPMASASAKSMTSSPFTSPMPLNRLSMRLAPKALDRIDTM